MRRFLYAATLVVFAMCQTVYADTLTIIGVVVRPTNERVKGATVKLYSTSNSTGTPLATDTASERGVFNLYRTNVAGDLGDLFVVYEGGEGAAAPLKVTLAPSKNGLIEARTADLVVKPAAEAGKLTQQEAAEAVAAVSSTAAVLVQAGVWTEEQAKAQTAAKASAILSKIPKTEQLDIKSLDSKTSTVIRDQDFKNFKVDPKATASETIKTVISTQGRGGRGGGYE